MRSKDKVVASTVILMGKVTVVVKGAGVGDLLRSLKALFSYVSKALS